MSTSVSGELHSWDTEDKLQMGRQARTYNYRVTASGGGTLRFKVEHFTGDELGVGADFVPGKWITIEERIKIESGHTTSGSFTLPETRNVQEGMGTMRLTFSRGLGTKGVDYDFFMEPA